VALLGGGLVGAALFGWWPELAWADTRTTVTPGLLFGGPNAAPTEAVPLDPRLPTGRLRFAARLSGDRGARCSQLRPVCVRGADVATDLRALAALERAYERQRFGAGLPGPGAPQGRWVWNLGPRADGGAELDLEVKEMPSVAFDRAAAECRGGRPTDHDAQRCVAALAVVERAPASASSLVFGYASAASEELLGVDAEALDRLSRTQAHPELALVEASTDGAPSAPLDRSALFFRYLSEVARSAPAAEAGFLALTLAATKSPPAAFRFDAEPDVLDVLGHSLGESRARVAEFWDDFAAARLDIGQPDGFLQLAAPQLGPRFAWDVASNTLPRNLELPEPLGSTGSSYLRLRLSEADEGKTFAARISCEGPVSYVWSLGRRDAAGHALGRVRVAFREAAQTFEQRVEPVPGLREIVLVGTNLGGVDLAHPYDPDHAPHEPHLCRIYLARLP
jgi:hypothetical protein